MAHRNPTLALLFLFVFAPGLCAQTSEKPSQTAPVNEVQPKTVASKTEKSEEADSLQAQQRIVAVSLLDTLAENARSFRDQALRARVAARTADAFWETDAERARQLFRRAWDEASTADAEAALLREEEMQRQRRGGGEVINRRSRDLRAEVLRLAGRRDRALAEEFLKKVAEENERAKPKTTNPENDPSVSPEAVAKRLQLARQFLNDGDVERAMQFAGPALHSVTRETIWFLSALREKNAAAADQAFLSLIARAERDPAADANTVSGLSSYAFTPFFYVVSLKGGENVSQERREGPPPVLPEHVRAAFFRVATEILLRPLAPPEQDTTSSGRSGKFLVIKRLLPLFEQHSPEQAQLLKTQLAALSGDLSPEQRDMEDRGPRTGLVPDEDDDLPLDQMQDRLDRAKTADDRDQMLAFYAVTLSRKGDPKASELVEKISSADFRKHVRGYVDFRLGEHAITKNEATEAVRLAKSGELTNMQRIFLYIRAARILRKTDPARAVEVLEDAAAEARRISGTSPDRARGFVAVATLYLQSDRVRAWEYVSEALKAANAAEGFTGEDSSVSLMLRGRNMVMMQSANADEFDLLGLFRGLAKDDFNRSVEMARSFTGEFPRAVATLAVARSVLEQSGPETPLL